MVVDSLKNNIYDLVIQTKCFNLYDTLECGQCFRWTNTNFIDRNNSEFIGVISDRVIKIKQVNNELYISSNVSENLNDVINYYFDLYNNYLKIENTILKIDNNIKRAVKNSSGIHILNQNPFETLISFIISANNNIPRIKKSIDEISRRYGKRVLFEDKEYYLFPTINELQDVTIEEFKLCSVGFRDKYIVKTIYDIIDRNISFACLSKLTNSQLKTVLMSFSGVGPKVADCVMLFSFGRQDVFPIDVWIKRVMEKLYFKKEVSVNLINDYQSANFSSYSGIIQQHLFYNIRNQEI